MGNKEWKRKNGSIMTIFRSEKEGLRDEKEGMRDEKGGKIRYE